jgi:hypothetical protein
MKKTIYRLSSYSDDLPYHTISKKTINKFAKDIVYTTSREITDLIVSDRIVNKMEYKYEDIKKL